MEKIRYKSGRIKGTIDNGMQEGRLKFESNNSPGPGRYYFRESSNNGVKFPLAHRRPLFNVDENPAPGSYSIQSIFDNKKSFSFSPKLTKPEPKYPGPGSYDVKDVVTNSARPVIGKEKRKDNFLKDEQVSIPGPGRYNFRHTLVEGPQWRFGSEASRKVKELEQTPGPGAYEIPDTKSKIVFKFPSSRKNDKLENIPGPGHYNVQNKNRYAFFAMSRSEKYQKLSGPFIPGPGEYNYSISSFRVLGSSKSILSNELLK